MRVTSILFAILTLSGCSEKHTEHATSKSPYVSEADRTIKALSAEEIEGYLAGDGLGYAIVAELNSYPGPRHVLDLAEQLDLTEEQLAQTRAEFESMQQKARELGRKFVDLEAELERQFANQSVTITELASQLAEIAETESKIRQTHLESHVRMKDILSADQVQMYDQHRGYQSGMDHDHQGDHSGHS